MAAGPDINMTVGFDRSQGIPSAGGKFVGNSICTSPDASFGDLYIVSDHVAARAENLYYLFIQQDTVYGKFS